MSDSFFLDTNVFVSRFDLAAPAKARRAEELIERGLAGGTGTISFQVIQEFCNVMTRKIERPLSSPELAEYVGRVFRPMVTVESSLFLELAGLELRQRYRVAWYDALIIAAAVQAGCRTLFTEDLQHGQRFDGVLVQNPFLPAQ